MKRIFQLITANKWKINFFMLLTFSMLCCGINEDEEIANNILYAGLFTDSRDNHEYKWVKIGEQTWMAENLAYLPAVNCVKPDSTYLPHYYIYGYDDTNVKIAITTSNYNMYGVLYDWKAAMKACPKGWHLPSDTEWKHLEKSLGMTQTQADDIFPAYRGTDQGSKMKNTVGWINNGNGTNISGFSALPGGFRFANGNFGFVEDFGYWWSSEERSDGYAWSRGLYYKTNNVYRSASFKENGFCVRCLLD